MEYVKRLVYGKTIGNYDYDYSELFNQLFDIEISSCEARKRFYGIRNLLDILEDENSETVISGNSNLLEELTQKQIEVEKEKNKLQTEKSAIKEYTRESARVELLIEQMKNEIKLLPELKTPRININPYQENDNEDIIHAIGGIADAHFGVEYKIKGLKGEILNEYSPCIFYERMYSLLAKYIKIIEKEKIEVLHFIELGDSIEGMLRNSILQYLKYGIIESVMKYSEFLAEWLNLLSEHVYINYYSTRGNHSELRILNGKSGDFAKENVEILITWFLKERLKDNDNININVNENDLVCFAVNNKNIVATHGQNDKDVVSSIKDLEMFYGDKINMFICGHWHNSQSKTAGMNGNDNVECVIFPSICGVDDFSKKIKKSAKPGSKLIVFSDDSVNKIIYDLVLT